MATAHAENIDWQGRFTYPGPECDVGFCIQGAVMISDTSVLVIGSVTTFSITLLATVCIKTGRTHRGPRQCLDVCQATIIIPFRDDDHFLLLGGNIPISSAAPGYQSLPQVGGYTQILDAITMTFEEGPYIKVDDLSARDYFAAVPLPPSNEREQQLTLLLGHAHDANLTSYIVVPEPPQIYAMTESEEENYIASASEQQLEGEKAAARDRICDVRRTRVRASDNTTVMTTTTHAE
jgi:hypothetical protein